MNSSDVKGKYSIEVKKAVNIKDISVGLLSAHVVFDFNRNSSWLFEYKTEVFHAILLTVVLFNFVRGIWMKSAGSVQLQLEPKAGGKQSGSVPSLEVADYFPCFREGHTLCTQTVRFSLTKSMQPNVICLWYQKQESKRIVK